MPDIVQSEITETAFQRFAAVFCKVRKISPFSNDDRAYLCSRHAEKQRAEGL